MSSSDEALEYLKSWKSGSIKLYMYWAIAGVSGHCEGILTHVSEGELHFSIEGTDSADFLFVINVHPVHHTSLRILTLQPEEDVPFFAPRREKERFGRMVEIRLQRDAHGEYKGRVVLAEIFPAASINP